MRKTLIIVAIVAVAVGVWWFMFRRPRPPVGQTSYAVGQPAQGLPPVQPAPGSSLRWDQTASEAAGAAAQAACAAKGGGQLCSLAAPVATKFAQLHIDAGKKAVSVTKKAGSAVASGTKKLLGKIF